MPINPRKQQKIEEKITKRASKRNMYSMPLRAKTVRKSNSRKK